MTSTGAPPGEPEPFHLLSVDSGDWWCVLTLTGELDMASGPGLREAVDDALREVGVTSRSTPPGLSFIDSSGLMALLKARQQATAAGGSLRLTATSVPVTRVLELTGLADELLDRRR